VPENSTALDDAEGFRSALLCEDDIGKVIRTHIYIESVLNEFIEFALMNPSYLKPLSLDYFGKVHLAACIGLNEDLIKPLLQIGNIRNRFAHRPNQIINKEIVNNFYASFSGKQKVIINSISKNASDSEAGDSQQGAKEDTNEKFMSLSMALFYLLKIDVSAFTQSTKIQELLQAIGELHANTSTSNK
jgi:hypothetical protein